MAKSSTKAPTTKSATLPERLCHECALLMILYLEAEMVALQITDAALLLGSAALAVRDRMGTGQKAEEATRAARSLSDLLLS